MSVMPERTLTRQYGPAVREWQDRDGAGNEFELKLFACSCTASSRLGEDQWTAEPHDREKCTNTAHWL